MIYTDIFLYIAAAVPHIYIWIDWMDINYLTDTDFKMSADKICVWVEVHANLINGVRECVCYVN